MKTHRPSRAAPDPLGAVFAALADPTRRAILARLATGDTNVTELAAPFRMTMPAVTKHLKVLERAGLVTRGRLAQWRPCRLEAHPLREAADWIGQYRQFWEQPAAPRQVQAASAAGGASGASTAS